MSKRMIELDTLSSMIDEVVDFKSSVRMIELSSIGDERGQLIAIEENNPIPFDIRRVYYMYRNQPNSVRGNHAHKRLKQLLICVSGSCVVQTETAFGDILSHDLCSPQQALYIDGLVWRELLTFSLDAVVVVLASDIYNEKDYIRDYSEFKRYSLLICPPEYKS